MNYAHSLRSVVDFEFYEFFKLPSLQMDVGSLGACADGSVGTRSASGSGPNSAAFGAAGSPEPRTRIATGAKAITNRPSIIIAHTIPGKGVDFMEYDYRWHGMPPNSEQAQTALRKLRTLDGKIRHEGEGV